MTITNWLSVAGAGKVLKALYWRLFFPDQEGQKQDARVLAEYGEALKKLAEARQATAKAEQMQLETLKQTAVLFEELGMPRQRVLNLIEQDLSRLNRLGDALRGALEEYKAEDTTAGK